MRQNPTIATNVIEEAPLHLRLSVLGDVATSINTECFVTSSAKSNSQGNLVRTVHVYFRVFGGQCKFSVNRSVLFEDIAVRQT